jgi:hypothetical protein
MDDNTEGWKELAKRQIQEINLLARKTGMNDKAIRGIDKEQALIKQRLETLEANYEKSESRIVDERTEDKRSRIEAWKIALTIGTILIALAMLALAVIQAMSKLMPLFR